MTNPPGVSGPEPPVPAPPGQTLYEAAVRLLSGARLSDIPESLRLLRQASAEGHAEADARLAVMSGMGVGMVPRWDEALNHLERAAERGSVSARGQLRALAADEVAAGTDLQDPRAWCSLRQSIALDTFLAKPEKSVVSPAPRIVAIKNFLPVPLCEWLIERARGRVQRALVYDAESAAGRAGSGRSNTAFEFGFLDLDLVVLLVRARIAAAIGMPVVVFEPPQVLHYEVGEQFARHHDYFDPQKAGHAAQIAARGQRIVTFLVYLNAGYEGGETDFPLIGVRHRGGAGDALYFGNINPERVPDPRTLHAGLAPTQGEKWLLSQWVRDRPWGA